MKKFKKNITKKRIFKNKRRRIHRKTIKNFDGGLSLKKVATAGLLSGLSTTQALRPNRNGLTHFQHTQPSNSLFLKNNIIPSSTPNSYELPVKSQYIVNSSGLPPEQPPTYKKWVSFDEPERHITPTYEEDTFKEIVNKYKQGRAEDYGVSKIKEYTGRQADKIFGESDIKSPDEVMNDFITNNSPQEGKLAPNPDKIFDKSVPEIIRNIKTKSSKGGKSLKKSSKNIRNCYYY